MIDIIYGTEFKYGSYVCIIQKKCILYCSAFYFIFLYFFSVIQLLQEVRDIKQELTRTRRNSGHESEISVIGTSYLRRRRTHPGNRRIVEVRKCRLARRRGQWPSYCDRLLRQRTADGTQIASSGI